MYRKPAPLSCKDCYFRREGLCALASDVPCPTFRLASLGSLMPPRQAQLVPRPPVTLPQPAAA